MWTFASPGSSSIHFYGPFLLNFCLLLLLLLLLL